ncbi:MAG: glycosyltransferase family A protein, partial [Desulfobulbaceae bacterium]|nr:glycosyltransferase family A protein [Desulfobulbaceae bacterium]
MMRTKGPAITVLMPAHNAAWYVREAVASILSQTFQDFELLIIDDGSVDSTSAVIESISDSRIRLVRNSKNLGLIATLNKGIELARGRYIARMDADDISLPRRFEWQYQLMERSPQVVACSGWSVDVCPGVWNKYNFREADHDTLLGRMFVESPLSHPASFIRRSTLLESGIRYDTRYAHCEDYRFWFDLSKVGRLSNVQKMVLRYRVVETSVSQLHGEQQAATARKLRREIVDDFFQKRGVSITIPEQITSGYLHEFIKLYDTPTPAGVVAREMYLRQLSFLHYSLYMSQQDYDLPALFRFLASGDYLRYGIRGKRAAKIVVKHLFPRRF